MGQLGLSPAALAETIGLIEGDVISGKIAKELLPELLAGGGAGGVRALVEARGLGQISDPAAIDAMVDRVRFCGFRGFGEAGGRVHGRASASACQAPLPRALAPPPLPSHASQNPPAPEHTSLILPRICPPARLARRRAPRQVLAASPGQLAEYRGGKTKLAGYFTGQVMKESGGRVNPGLMNAALMRKLNAAP